MLLLCVAACSLAIKLMRRWRAVLPVLLAVVILAARSEQTEAQVIINWTDLAGGNYNDVLNWSSFNIPDTTSESARFNIGGDYDVFLFVDRTVSDLLVNSGDVTMARTALAANDATYTVDDDAFVTGATFTLEELVAPHDITLIVTDELEVHDAGFFHVREGSDVQVNGQLRIGADSSGNGVFTLDGVGTTLTTSAANVAVIGSSGSMGTLSMSNSATGDIGNNLHVAASGVSGTGGQVNVSTSSVLDVAGDLLMVTGTNTNQNSSLAVNDTAMFTVGGNVNIGTGTSTNQTATVTVDGTFSQSGATTFNFGTSNGAGNSSDLMITSNGTVTTGTGQISIGNTAQSASPVARSMRMATSR